LLAHGRWLSPGTPASPTTKTGRHVIVEILLKVALNTEKSKKNQKSNQTIPETYTQDKDTMKESVVTNGLRVRSEGIAVTVTASMLLTKALGYPFKRNLFLFFVVLFLMCCLFFPFFCHSSGKSFADVFTPSVQDLVMMHLKTLLSVLTEENFCSMLKWKT
jgi:hypothetical protein